MRGAPRLLLTLGIVALLAIGLAACGGGDSSDSTAAGTTASEGTTAPTTTEDQGSGKGEPEQSDDKGRSSQGSDDSPGDDDFSSGSGKGSASFRTPGGDNSIQNYGEEADSSETAAAGSALANYLRTRAKDDWSGECKYLAKVAIAPLEELAQRSPQLKGGGCAAILSALSAGTPISTRANTMTSGLASLRFEGERGFALYHGPKGVNYFVPMVKEDGQWKVGALAPSEFP